MTENKDLVMVPDIIEDWDESMGIFSYFVKWSESAVNIGFNEVLNVLTYVFVDFYFLFGSWFGVSSKIVNKSVC